MPDDDGRLDAQASANEALSYLVAIRNPLPPERLREELEDAASQCSWIKSAYPDMWKGVLVQAVRSIRHHEKNLERAKAAVLDSFEPGRRKNGATPQSHKTSDKKEKVNKAPPLITFGAFYDGEGIATAPKALIKGLLPRHGVCVIGGQSGAGKSYFCVDLMVSLASGTAFFGRHAVELVGVLYAAPEGSSTIQPRINAAKLKRGMPLAPLPIMILPEFFFPKLDMKDGDKAIAHYISSLEGAIAALGNRFGDVAWPGVLFIDTASAGIDMDDENSNSEIAEVCRRMARLAKETNCLIILIHHHGKDDARGLRGASAWRANTDHVISIMTDRNKLTGVTTARNVICEKSRVGPEGPIAGFRLATIEMGKDEDGDVWTEAAIEEVDFKTPEGNQTSAKPTKPKKGMRIFSEAFIEVLGNSGVKRSIRGSSPVLCAVLKAVRIEFNRRYGTGESNPASETAKRKEWSRQMKDIAAQFTDYRTEVDGNGIEWVWRPKDGETVDV